ncbi:MAG: hypothetical protein HZB47_08400 [Nitrosomonadales bacterium]|nr:hypothetical protein [Nitrosomonadales bacterium]
MKTTNLQFASLLLGSLLVAGCKTLPVASHAINCDVGRELLAGKCAAPSPIAGDATYAALVDAMQADRKALQECSIAADTLRETLKRCNRATAEYNKKVDALGNANY